MRVWRGIRFEAAAGIAAGDSELYSHPSLDEFKHEFDALVSPAVKELVKELGIELIATKTCSGAL